MLAACLEMLFWDLYSLDIVIEKLFGSIIEFEPHPNSEKGFYGKQQECHENTSLNGQQCHTDSRILSTKLYLLKCLTSKGQSSYDR